MATGLMAAASVAAVVAATLIARSGDAPAAAAAAPGAAASIDRSTSLGVRRLAGGGTLALRATGRAGGRVLEAGEPVTLTLRAPGHRAIGAVRVGPARGRPMPGGPGQALLVRRAGGEAVAPALPGSGSAHGHPAPGAGLAASTGATDLWAVKVSAGPDAVTVDPGGRVLAASYARDGRVEVVDLVRRGPALRIEGLGRLGSVGFSPDGRTLWADDLDGGVRLIDVATGRDRGALGSGTGPQSVAFGPSGDVVAVAGSSPRAVEIIDVRSGRTRRTSRLEADPSGVVLGGAAAVVGHAGGRVTLLPIGGSRSAPRTLRVGDGAGPAILGAAPDGRTVVAALPDADTAALIDTLRGRVVARVATGRAPSEIAFLARRFALIRNASSPDVTWVDLEDPRRAADLRLDASPSTSLAALGGGRALAVSPTERRVFELHVMMGRPMVMGILPNALSADVVLGIPGGARRRGPSEWERSVTFPRAGRYEVRVRLRGEARAVRFPIVVREGATGPRVVAARRVVSGRVGIPVRVRFRVAGADPASAEVLAYSVSASAGVRQQRVAAREGPAGTWSAVVTPAAPGSYNVRLLSEDAGIGAGAGPGTTLRVP